MSVSSRLRAYARWPDHLIRCSRRAVIPGVGTGPTSINALGVIVGSFFDANFVVHGFIRSPGGTFTIIDAPGATTLVGSGTGTWASGINLQGVVTGNYADTNGANHGFVWTPCNK